MIRKIIGIITLLKRTVTIRLIIVVLFACLISSCEKEIDWKMQEKVPETIVVEALLTNERRVQRVKLSRPMKTPNETPGPVTGATVRIETGNITLNFTESLANPGTYLSDIPFSGTINNIYRLYIYDGDELYTSQTYMIPVSIPDSPKFELNSATNMLSINWNNPQFHPFEQAMYKADISWGHLPVIEWPDTLTRATVTYFTFSTIDVSYNIAPQEEEDIFFPAGSLVVFSKYSLTPEYANYLRALVAETKWQGSIFEHARGNLPGNISNGGLGFFSASSVVRIRVVAR